MELSKSTITLTFGDCAENHKGMEMIGTRGSKGSGYSVEELRAIRIRCEEAGFVCRTGDLSVGISKEMPPDIKIDPAHVLVIKGGLDLLTGIKDAHKALFEEQAGLEVDTKAFMYGRVVNKKARWNLCFAEEGHPPAYEEGKGRVIPYEAIPVTKKLVTSLPTWFGDKAKELKGEANYYYDIKKCGIGYHGDTERRKVIAVRLGAAMPLFFQWHWRGEQVGHRMELPLDGGDLYIMSEKAVGTDWKSSSLYTLRHAAGCAKFTD